MHTSVPLVRKPDSSGVPTASEALGRRWRDSLVFPRMPANPLVVVSVGERKVADDGVRQIIPFTYLHLAAEYGQLRSNSNRLAWSCLKLHCAGKPSFRGSPRRSLPAASRMAFARAADAQQEAWVDRRWYWLRNRSVLLSSRTKHFVEFVCQKCFSLAPPRFPRRWKVLQKGCKCVGFIASLLNFTIEVLKFCTD